VLIFYHTHIITLSHQTKSDLAMSVAAIFWGGLFLTLASLSLFLLGGLWQRLRPPPGGAGRPSPRLSLLIAAAATLGATAFLHPPPVPLRGAPPGPGERPVGFTVPPEGLQPLTPWSETRRPEPGRQHALSGPLTGVASWYGPGFEGRKTASGERFRSRGLTLASRLLPLGSTVEITNLANGKRLTARVNDRGPYVEGRKFDVSRGVARKLGFQRQGLARVKVRLVEPGRPSPR